MRILRNHREEAIEISARVDGLDRSWPCVKVSRSARPSVRPQEPRKRNMPMMLPLSLPLQRSDAMGGMDLIKQRSKRRSRLEQTLRRPQRWNLLATRKMDVGTCTSISQTSPTMGFLRIRPIPRLSRSRRTTRRRCESIHGTLDRWIANHVPPASSFTRRRRQ